MPEKDDETFYDWMYRNYGEGGLVLFVSCLVVLCLSIVIATGLFVGLWTLGWFAVPVVYFYYKYLNRNNN